MEWLKAMSGHERAKARRYQFEFPVLTSAEVVSIDPSLKRLGGSGFKEARVQEWKPGAAKPKVTSPTRASVSVEVEKAATKKLTLLRAEKS